MLWEINHFRVVTVNVLISQNPVVDYLYLIINSTPFHLMHLENTTEQASDAKI